MARSDDIYRANAAGGVDLAFVVPDEGGLMRTEVMCVPAHAANRGEAIRFMDHVYRPDVAAEIAGSLASISPVRGVRERLLGIAASTSDPVEAARVMAAASSPLLFPSDADIARLTTYREFENDDEIARWDAAFGDLLGAIALPSS
jgi:spermidine/putrescine transport system substrate-binding protein